MLPDSIQPTEVAILVVGAGGALNMWFLLLDSWGDYDYIQKRRINGTRRAVAQMSLQTTAVYMYTMIAMGLYAIFAMTQGPLLVNRQVTPNGIALAIMVLSIAVVMNYDAVNRRMKRHYVLEEEARRYQRQRELQLRAKIAKVLPPEHDTESLRQVLELIPMEDEDDEYDDRAPAS